MDPPSTDVWPLLGPPGPFPRVPLTDLLERRWLHYAFFSRDGALSMIANLARLGTDAHPHGFSTAVLLVHDLDRGWSCSQWNADHEGQPWSSFASGRAGGRLELRAARHAPRVSLSLSSTSTPSSSQCATFHRDHWMRWQSEPGVEAEGLWEPSDGPTRSYRAVGYHERVRGRWGWPEMGGWVFGFCNSLRDDGHAPSWSVVFTLLQPAGEPSGHAGSVMLWRRGRHIRHFPRNALRVGVAGQLDRDRVVTLPKLAHTLGTPSTVPIPAALAIDGHQGGDRVELRFLAREAARLVIPSETSRRAFSVHEVIGDMRVELRVEGDRQTFEGPGVVEFAGGAGRGEDHVY